MSTRRRKKAEAARALDNRQLAGLLEELRSRDNATFAEAEAAERAIVELEIEASRPRAAGPSRAHPTGPGPATLRGSTRTPPHRGHFVVDRAPRRGRALVGILHRARVAEPGHSHGAADQHRALRGVVTIGRGIHDRLRELRNGPLREYEQEALLIAMIEAMFANVPPRNPWLDRMEGR